MMVLMANKTGQHKATIPDYHKATDTFEKVNAGNYFSNCKAALELLKQVSF